MIPYAVRYGDVLEEEVVLCDTVRGWLSKLPDAGPFIDERGIEQLVSCHMLTRAVKRLLPDLRVVDGFYYPSYEHSWLLTPKGNILDVYPVAGASGPLLLMGEYPSPAHFLYRPARLRVRYGERWFRQAVNQIAAELRAVQATLFGSTGP